MVAMGVATCRGHSWLTVWSVHSTWVSVPVPSVISVIPRESSSANMRLPASATWMQYRLVVA